MKNLHVYLPPFSPDYSGVGSALYGLGGMMIYHDASGCTGNYIGYDEPRWMKRQDLVYCSGLRHLDAVLGRDDRLIDRAIAAVRDMNPAFLAIVGSPVPMLVGTDYEGIAREIEDAVHIPVFGFDTKGFDFYDRGVKMAALALLDRFSGSPADGSHGGDLSVNIVGMTPIDFGNENSASSVRHLFESNGIRVNCMLPMAASLEEISGFYNAGLNVALSLAGVQICESVGQKTGMPFISGVPIGDGRRMLERVLSFFNLGANVCKAREKAPHTGSGRHWLIVGEQVYSNSLREEIEDRGDTATVAVPFNCHRSLLRDGDYPFVQEEDLFRLFRDPRFTDVAGDPLFRQLLPSPGPVFHEIAHVAVSSRFGWDRIPDCIGLDVSNR